MSDEWGATKCPSLGQATERGHLEVVKMLLECEGINVNQALRRRRWAPLHLAADRDYTKIAEVLLRHHSTSVNLPTINNTTPLFSAARKGDTDIFMLLLQHHDIDVNLQCVYQNEISLHEAAGGGHLEII